MQGALQIQSAQAMFAIRNMTVLSVISYLALFWIKVLAVCGKPVDWQRIVGFCACGTIFAVSSRLYGLFEPLRIAIFANNLAWGQHNLRLFGQIALLSGFGSERMVRCAARSFKKAAAAQTYIVKIPAAVLLIIGGSCWSELNRLNMQWPKDHINGRG